MAITRWYGRGHIYCDSKAWKIKNYDKLYGSKNWFSRTYPSGNCRYRLAIALTAYVAKLRTIAINKMREVLDLSLAPYSANNAGIWNGMLYSTLVWNSTLPTAIGRAHMKNIEINNLSNPYDRSAFTIHITASSSNAGLDRKPPT